MPTNDNAPPAEPVVAGDPSGQAALLLVESLMHGLCENATLTTEAAIAITERALAVRGDVAEAADGAGAPLWRSHELLSAIVESLRTDRIGPPPPPRLVK